MSMSPHIKKGKGKHFGEPACSTSTGAAAAGGTSTSRKVADDGTAATGSEETQDMKVVGCPSRGLPAPRENSKYCDVCGNRPFLKHESDLTRLPI